jgi:hypothetical protein
MRSDREERIRQRAYAIWQSEGHGHGREEEHWHRAEREIAAEEAGSIGAPRSGKAAAEKSAAAIARSRGGGTETRAQKPASPKKPPPRDRKPAKDS